MPGPDRKRRLTAFVVAMAVLIVTPLAVVASDRFNDVPDSNIFHDDIAWLADNDVTRGCNPPDNDEFCPSDNVTRQQMAAFMRRLAENEVVNAATANEADNADTLDGQDSSAYSTVVGHAACVIDGPALTTSCDPLPDQTTVELLSVTLDVPSTGVIQVSVDTWSNGTFWVTLDDACASYSSPAQIFDQILNGAIYSGILATDAPFLGTSAATEVAPGSRTVRLCGVYESTDGGGAALTGHLTAQWTAGGSVAIQSSGQVPTTGFSTEGSPLLGG